MIIKVTDEQAVVVVSGVRRLEATLSVFGKAIAEGVDGLLYVVTRQNGSLVAHPATELDHSGVVAPTNDVSNLRRRLNGLTRR